ncbi:SoxR reducing system RseC family protein [Candidatus Halobeggiatoa sp. HSG11]|nr:SoxR reducing system RseC family protein [Candidatus Halobeggiatoa sp. HSG11]
MLEERGTVTSVDEQFITVRTRRSNSCGGCTASCGTGSLANVLGKKYTEIKFAKYKNVKVGDTVIISLNEQSLLKNALVLYLFPLLFMFTMAIGCKMWQQSELFTTLAGLVGLLLGLFIAKLITVKMSKNVHHQPTIRNI